MPVFNPTRRNRNIGTAKQGRGQDNRLIIPEIAGSNRVWNEQLQSFETVRRYISGREIIFLIEETFPGFVHACSADDVCRILSHVPLSDWEGLNTFVFRQSTRKQRILQPVWGRMFYYADIGLPGRPAVRQGPAVMLEATLPDETIKWPLSLGPEGTRELERLRSDGHDIVNDGRHHVVTIKSEATRATQLYRTLLHEIGHWVDFLTKVDRPSDRGEGDYSSLSDLYFARPKDEREAFAHRYADEQAERLKKFGIIPFDPRPDEFVPVAP